AGRFCWIRSVIVAWGHAIVGGLQQHPGHLADGAVDKLHVTVAEGGVDAAGVPASGLTRHAILLGRAATIQTVSGADARIPEAPAALDLIGLVEAIVRRRIIIAAGARHARSRHPHCPDTPAVLRI